VFGPDSVVPDLAQALRDARPVSAPDLSAHARPDRPPAPLGPSHLWAWQGLQGGVGVTTVLCAVAARGAALGYPVVILDLGGDCAATLGQTPEPARQEPYITQHGIVIYPPELLPPDQVGPLCDMHRGRGALVLVDAGTIQDDPPALVAALDRGGHLFLLATPRCEFLVDTTYQARYRPQVLINRETRATWRHTYAQHFPEDEGVTAAINHGRLAEHPGALLAAAEVLVRQGGYHG
ncbi:MAG: ParA family protein, partial [Chloroflexi bacterium]|nr:ParA family protein [Chloroflexota bacterium]